MLSKNVEQLLQEIYADLDISPIEVVKLREQVNEAEQKILDEEGCEGVVAALFKSFDVTNQLLQETLLKLKKDKYSETGQQMLKAAIVANIIQLKAKLRCFFWWEINRIEGQKSEYRIK